MIKDVDKGFHYSYYFSANVCNKCRKIINGPPAVHLDKCKSLKKELEDNERS